jgi:hypothetical protein
MRKEIILPKVKEEKFTSIEETLNKKRAERDYKEGPLG